MDEKNKVQIIDFFNANKSFGIVLPRLSNIDLQASAIALFLALAKNEKELSIISNSSLQTELGFLSHGIELKQTVPNGSSFEIVVSNEHAKADQLSYQVEDDGLHIFLQAKNGKLSASDVKINEGQDGLDALIILGATSPEDLGNIYSDNTELFFKIPKLVIDNNLENTYFGNLNLVEVTSSSLGEIVAGLLLSSEHQWIDENVATALLTAITSATQSFQSIKTSPKALELAAGLINRGAKQQEVVKALYKTKPFSLLKLWGRALAKVQTSPNSKILYAALTSSDFEKTETVPEQINEVLTELLDNSSGNEVIAIFADGPVVKIAMACLPHINIDEILLKVSGELISKSKQGIYNKVFFEVLGKNFDEVQGLLIASIN